MTPWTPPADTGVWRICDVRMTLLYDCREGKPVP